MDLTPGPFPAGKGSPGDDLGLGMALDCGAGRNDGRLGAIHRAPTKNLPLSDMVPRVEGDGLDRAWTRGRSGLRPAPQ